MITQFQQSKYGYWSRVMVLPVALVLFCFVTLYAKKPAAANANEPAITANAVVGDNIIYEEPPNPAQSTSATATDTLPDKARIELEQMKLQQERLKELQDANRTDRELLQKQMRERQLLTEQRQQGKIDSNEKARRRQVEMEALQQQLESERKVQADKMERQIIESELKAKEDPAYREEHLKRVAQMKRELQDTVPAKKAIKAKEAKPGKPQKPAKSQKPAKGAKAEVKKVKEYKLREVKAGKVQEVRVEKEEEVEEVKEVRKVEKVSRPVEERVIKNNGTTRVLRLKPDSNGRLQRVYLADNRKLTPAKKNLQLKGQRKEPAKKRTLKIKPKTKEGSAPVSDQDNNETNYSGDGAL